MLDGIILTATILFTLVQVGALAVIYVFHKKTGELRLDTTQIRIYGANIKRFFVPTKSDIHRAARTVKAFNGIMLEDTAEVLKDAHQTNKKNAISTAKATAKFSKKAAHVTSRASVISAKTAAKLASATAHGSSQAVKVGMSFTKDAATALNDYIEAVKADIRAEEDYGTKQDTPTVQQVSQQAAEKIVHTAPITVVPPKPTRAPSNSQVRTNALVASRRKIRDSKMATGRANTEAPTKKFDVFVDMA